MNFNFIKPKKLIMTATYLGAGVLTATVSIYKRGDSFTHKITSSYGDAEIFKAEARFMTEVVALSYPNHRELLRDLIDLKDLSWAIAWGKDDPE